MATEKVERSIVRDTKQPPCGVVDGTDRRQRTDGLDHRVLDDIFAVDGRTGHARAIAMKLRTYLGQQSLEFCGHVAGHRHASCRSSVRSDVERDDTLVGPYAICDAARVARV